MKNLLSVLSLLASSLTADPHLVTTVDIHPQEVAIEMTFSGRLSPVDRVNVRPQVSGILLSQEFESGSLVKQGQILFHIDPAPYKAVVMQQKASLASAEAAVVALDAKAKRYRDLQKIAAVSEQDLADIEAALLQATAERDRAVAALETAQLELSYTEVKAPISGVIGRALITEGALVSAQQSDALARIVAVSPLYANLQVPADKARALRGKTIKSVTLDSGQVGSFKFLGVETDPDTEMALLRAEFANTDSSLMAGEFVRATLHLGTESALLVPQRAVQRGSQGAYCWRVQEGKAQIAPLKLGENRGDAVRVLSGLVENDKIVLEGYMMLRPGAEVVVGP